MNEQDAERILREALAAQARASVGDAAPPPPPRFAAETAPSRRRRPLRLLAPLAAAAAVLAVAGGIVAIADQSGSGSRHVAAVGGGTGTGTTRAPASTSGAASQLPLSASATTPRADQPVHIKLFNADGAQYGVGMPVVAYFSRRFTDARALASATTVTVDGAPTTAAWYFLQSGAGSGPIEGHLRPQAYWPAHAQVHVRLATQGLSAGAGLTFDDSLTLDFSTGARTVAVVRERTHDLTVTTDGKTLGPYPVSLGAAKTPTMRGLKVIMQKRSSVCMQGPGFKECGVKYPQQLTYSGEYLHSAPWNTVHIRLGIDSSNGCTNLLPTNAATLYKTLEVGDVVDYVDASGAEMTLNQGFGDWNVSWSRWLTGGLLRTS